MDGISVVFLILFMPIGWNYRVTQQILDNSPQKVSKKCQNWPKLAKTGLKVVQNWSKIGSKMMKKWLKTGQKVVQK